MACATDAPRAAAWPIWLLSTIIAGVLLVTGCATPRDQHMAAVDGANCSIVQVADVPFTLENGGLLVPATVNGMAARFVLDTGAAGGALTLNRSDRTNRRLKVVLRQSDAVAVGLSGEHVALDIGLAEEVRIGGAVIRNVMVAAPAERKHFMPSLSGDGIIGDTFLAGFDMEIDPRVRRLRLYEVSRCSGAFTPPFSSYSTLEMRRDRSGLPTVPLIVDGYRIDALLDTGSSVTMITPRGAERAGTAIGRIESAQRIGSVQDIGGAESGLRIVEFSKIQFGDRVFRNIKTPIAELDIAQDAIIGLDLILMQPIYISYYSGSVFLRSADGTAPTMAPSTGS